jgi:hypothetical protein
MEPTSSDFITTTEEVSGIEVSGVGVLDEFSIVGRGGGGRIEDESIQDDDDEDENYKDEEDKSSRSDTPAAYNTFSFPSLLQEPSSTSPNQDQHHHHQQHLHSPPLVSSKHLPHEALLRKIHLLELSLAEAQNLASLKTKALEDQIVLLQDVVATKTREIKEKDEEIGKIVENVFI